MYFNMYRDRPRKAMDEFADWCEFEGDDKFDHRVDTVVTDTAQEGFNVSEFFDWSLLQMTPNDLANAEIKRLQLPRPQWLLHRVLGTHSTWTTTLQLK
jgi:hypothetical protein